MFIAQNDIVIPVGQFLWRGTMLPPPSIEYLANGANRARIGNYNVAAFSIIKSARSYAGFRGVDRLGIESTEGSYGFYAEDFYNYQYGFQVAPYSAGVAKWSVFSLAQTNVLVGLSTSWLSGSSPSITLSLAFFNAGTNTFTLGGSTRYIAVFD